MGNSSDSEATMGNISEYSIMRATKRDIDEVINICRRCFPKSLKKQLHKFVVKRKWIFILESGAVEIYIIKRNGHIISFYELVVDVQLFNGLKGKESNILMIASYLVTAILHPKCAIHAGLNFLKTIRYSLGDNSKSLQGTRTVEAAKIAWGELQGVTQEHRGMGLSKLMQRYILTRCEALGKQVIRAIIDLENMPVLKLHKSFGYNVKDKTKYGYLIEKELIERDDKDFG